MPPSPVLTSPVNYVRTVLRDILRKLATWSCDVTLYGIGVLCFLFCSNKWQDTWETRAVGTTAHNKSCPLWRWVNKVTPRPLYPLGIEPRFSGRSAYSLVVILTELSGWWVYSSFLRFTAGTAAVDNASEQLKWKIRKGFYFVHRFHAPALHGGRCFASC